MSSLEVDWIVKLILAGLVGHLFWKGKKVEENRDDLNKRVTTLEVKQDTLSENVQEIKVDTKDIKKLLLDLMIKNGENKNA